MTQFSQLSYEVKVEHLKWQEKWEKGHWHAAYTEIVSYYRTDYWSLEYAYEEAQLPIYHWYRVDTQATACNSNRRKTSYIAIYVSSTNYINEQNYRREAQAMSEHINPSSSSSSHFSQLNSSTVKENRNLVNTSISSGEYKRKNQEAYKKDIESNSPL